MHCKYFNKILFDDTTHSPLDNISNCKNPLMNLVIQGNEDGKRKRGHPQISCKINIRSVTGLMYKGIFQTAEIGKSGEKRTSVSASVAITIDDANR